MQKNIIIIIILVVILAVSAVGLVVKSVYSPPEKQEAKIITTDPQKVKETDRDKDIAIEYPEPEPDDLTDEDQDFLSMLDMALAAEPNNQTQANSEYSEESTYGSQSYQQQEETSEDNDSESAEQIPKWRRIWQNLNLTEQERQRVRQGFNLAFQKFFAMNPEDQAAERQRLRDMRTRWDNMSLEERNATSQRIFDRFQEWRYSDRVELPELTLD